MGDLRIFCGEHTAEKDGKVEKALEIWERNPGFGPGNS
jgi:hypothetical protein